MINAVFSFIWLLIQSFAIVVGFLLAMIVLFELWRNIKCGIGLHEAYNDDYLTTCRHCDKELYDE